MKSNQRREAIAQLNRGKVLWCNPLRKLVGGSQEEEEEADGSHSLMTPSSHLNEHQQQQVTMSRNLRRNNEYCAINNNNKCYSVDQLELSSSNIHIKNTNFINNNINSNNNLDNSTQTMYKMITKRPSEAESDKQRRASVRLARPRHTASATRILQTGRSLSYIHRRTLTFVVISLALTSCIFINQIQAFSDSASGESPSLSSPSSPSQLSPQSASPSSDSSSSSSSSPSLASSIASSALSSISSAIISAALQDGKSSSNSPATGGGSELAPSPVLSSGPSSLSSALASSLSESLGAQSAPTSIAASLSSAVASAAAAAAVAAAQNSLSGGDARSLLTSNAQRTGNNHHHHQRNPGLHLAMKLADAIPEVPYNILHNMKKLDHAAPFYNVDKKVSYSGNSKESSHGLLSSALHASGNLGGAADQLSQLFRSPIWKRIADGYGDFASEFRSLFRVPTNTMKGPTNPRTKLLRDISVPALLMILASTIPSDWRPVRTRRKSLIPSDLAPVYPPLVDPMMASASSEFPTNYSPTPRLYGSMPNFNMAAALQQQAVNPQQQIGRELNPIAQMYNQFDQSAAAASSASPVQARTNDINLQQQSDAGASTVAWLQPQQVVAQSEPTNQMHNYDTQLHQIQLQQHPQQLLHHYQHNQPPSSIKRFGDSLLSALSLGPANDSTKTQLIHSDSKPVNGYRSYSNNLASSSPSPSSTGSLFSSLTSSLANQVGQSKLMSRLRNANVASISSGGASLLQPTNSHRVSAQGSGSSLMNNDYKMSSMSRDNLNDRHGYSLVDNDSVLNSGGNRLSERQQQKPHLLSAMTQAFGSMLASSPLESGSSLSHSPSPDSAAIINRKMFILNGANSNSNSDKGNRNSQNPFIDHHHPHHDPILRRNHQAASGAMEQRELSKLIPQSWREVVKRTVNSVHEQATTQWRSIEGQLTNWVQDKLKTLPVATGAASSSSGSSSSASATTATVSAPVANIFASVGSTALNMLGLGGKSQAGSSIPTSTTVASSAAPAAGASVSADEAQASTPVLKSKNDSVNKSKQPTAKGALVGVANMIVSTLANRQSPTSSSSSSSSSSSQHLKPKTAMSSGDEPNLSSSGSPVSQYPTLTGVQVGSSQSPSTSSVDSAAAPSSSSGTASTTSLTAS